MRARLNKVKMKKLIVLILFSTVIVFSDQTAINSDSVKFILKDDGTWLITEIPDELNLPISPFAITEDSQLILLKEDSWEYISPDDTVGVTYDSITTAILSYQLVEKKPIPQFIPMPKYPTGREIGHEGLTVVKVLVGFDGDVLEVGIIKSSGYMDLDHAAIKVAWKAKFIPAEYNGKPVRVWVSIPIRFKLYSDR